MPLITIALPLVPLAVGDLVDRSAWVPHVTLIGNFLLSDGAVDIAIAVLRRFAAEVPPISVRVEGEAWFGPHGSVLVDLVEAPALRALHGACSRCSSPRSTGSRCSSRPTRATTTTRTGR